MKTLHKQIILVMLCLAFSFGYNLYSQTKKTETKKNYVRVYNFKGKKISKGYIYFMNDSILGLKNNGKLVEMSLREIDFIKTKRSAGNNVFIGAVSGATLGAVIGVSTADSDIWILPYSKGEGAIVFGGIGAVGGIAIGGITSLFKRSETYVINGDIKKWQVFMNLIEKQSE
ncbi:hypothetical protein [uncultured Wocania sp.]|uniref:hypothetical protein n=1 Tax=uncultured Wocania sp. TaxID=2834404 RepID=UPI0030F7500C